MRKVKLSIIGFGVVGKGFAKALIADAEILHSLGIDAKVIAIVDLPGSIIDKRGIDLERVLKETSEKGFIPNSELKALDVINNLKADIVVEATPTNINTGEPGLSHIVNALKNKQHVITSNKGPLVVAYKRLMDLARENNVELRFEATVGGAMPIVNLAREILLGYRIKSIRGIFNGTCNYILTRMTDEGFPYEHILSEARELGIAEANPVYDVEGIDTASKLVILANSIFNLNATYEDVKVTGITKITPEALKLASEIGYAIKLIGEVAINSNGYILEVAPKMIPKTHPLNVGGTLNVASIQTELAGEITVTGRGAGALEAASAMISDLIAIARAREKRI
jgi:homoserine dehydrogenase